MHGSYEGLLWGVFGAVMGIGWVFGWAWLSHLKSERAARRRLERLRMLHEERMVAMEKGVSMPEFPELEEEEEEDPFGLRALHGAPVNPRWPLGLGAILVCLGAGVLVAFLLSPDPKLEKMWSLGLLGVFGGVGFFLHYVLTRGRGS